MQEQQHIVIMVETVEHNIEAAECPGQHTVGPDRITAKRTWAARRDYSLTSD